MPFGGISISAFCVEPWIGLSRTTAFAKYTVFKNRAVVIALELFLFQMSATAWNPESAAAYLDQRASWWASWSGAARDDGTFCVSCHTAAPYALARLALRRSLSQTSLSTCETRLLSSVTKRVRLWGNVKPYYGDDANGSAKAAESRGTEAVLNALILASADAENGRLGKDASLAFDHMWALQIGSGDRKGAWPWLDFGNEPFEARDSGYYGAAMAAIAAGTAPQSYRADPAIEGKIRSLCDYLNRECPRQPAINRVVLLWASARLPGLLSENRRQAIIDEILDAQRADGGWSLASLAWSWKSTSLESLTKLWMRADSTPLDPRSDGYATGLIIFALEQAGLHHNNPNLRRGLAWLERNQNRQTGSWPGYSLNKHTDASSATGLFMTDAATAYAVLALTP